MKEKLCEILLDNRKEIKMNQNSSWLPKAFFIGTFSVLSIGIFSYFNSATKKTEKKIKKKKEISKLNLNLEELWLQLHNLKEIENWEKIKEITQNSENLLLKTFFAESISNLKQIEESKKILNSIVEMEPKDENEEFAIGRAFQLLKNYEKAFEFFTKASQKNQIFANFSLGIYYQNGIVIPKDEKKGIEFFQKAADKNDPAAIYLLSITLPDDQIALDLLNKSSEMNYLPAIMTVGEMNSKRDPKLAFECYQKAAEMGHPKAQLNLAVYYSTGKGVEQNPKDSYFWCEKAASAGLPNALYLLGSFQIEGMGCEKDSVKAFKNIQLSADKGFPSAQYLIAKMLIENDKLDEGVEMLEKAAKSGHQGALKMIEELVIYENDPDYVTDDEK
jgi:TPR repeat protein